MGNENKPVNQCFEDRDWSTFLKKQALLPLSSSQEAISSSFNDSNLLSAIFALKLYTMLRLETKYDLLPRFQINIASINLVSKSIYLLASSKFGQSLLVMRNYLEDLSQSVNYFERIIIYISIYTLSDIGDLRNLIGSLSRTIQQYLPPSEWIMCELGFFPFS